MKGIIDAFTWLISTIKMLVGFVVSLIQSIIYLFQYLFSIMQIVQTFIATLPPWLIAFGQISLTVCVLYITLGRSAGKND